MACPSSRECGRGMLHYEPGGPQYMELYTRFLCISLLSKIGKTYTRLQELLLELGLSVS